jgi:SOS response regulatory protein OraA/RecX
MALTLEIKKNDPKTLILLWEGEKWREVYKSLFFSDLVKFPSGLPWEEFTVRFTAIEEKVARRYAISLLSKRSYLSSVLEAKLMAKGIGSETAKRVVAACSEKGYLDDAQEVERLFAKETRRGLSARVAYFKLKQSKKLSDAQLRQHFQQAQNNDVQNLQRWLKKNAAKIRQDDPKEMRKLAAKLCRRGFSMELVFKELLIRDN